MELTDGLLLIAASGVGAVCGILGQGIRDWMSRPRINIMALADEHSSAVFLYFINTGRKSTEDLMIDIVNTDVIMPTGNEKTVYHTTDVTIHPRTAYVIPFGRLDGETLIIRRSDFGRTVKYSDDGDEELKEWVFPLPVSFNVYACAKDTKACMRVVSVDGNGIHVKGLKRISYSTLKRQSASNDENNGK
jgi:hypothetical protein